MKTLPHLYILLLLAFTACSQPARASDRWGRYHDSRLDTPRSKDLPPPSDELLRQIQSDFVQLPLPLEVRFERRYRGDGSEWYRVLLYGDAKLLQFKYQPEEVVLALYPYIGDSQHGDEAALIIKAITEASGDYWLDYLNKRKTQAWQDDRKHRSQGVRIGAGNLLGSRGGKWVRAFTDRSPKVSQAELLPYSLKTKSLVGSWFSRLFR
jgi:hypothetical protein